MYICLDHSKELSWCDECTWGNGLKLYIYVYILDWRIGKIYDHKDTKWDQVKTTKMHSLGVQVLFEPQKVKQT